MSQGQIPKFNEETGRDVTVLTTFNASALRNVYYQSYMHNELALPLLPCPELVEGSKGTGLVHLSYAHGFDDYQVSESYW